LGVGLAIFLYQYIKAKVTDKEEDVIEDAETELDYINPSEIKTKRKPVIKKTK
jgi:ATP:corrinoid adenosyltransferase